MVRDTQGFDSYSLAHRLTAWVTTVDNCTIFWFTQLVEVNVVALVPRLPYVFNIHNEKKGNLEHKIAWITSLTQKCRPITSSRHFMASHSCNTKFKTTTRALARNQERISDYCKSSTDKPTLRLLMTSPTWFCIRPSPLFCCMHWKKSVG